MAAPENLIPEPLARFAARLEAGGDAPAGGSGVLVAVAHADDETIGLGGQLERLRPITIVHVTDGAPRKGNDARDRGFGSPEDYAAARRGELEAAMAEAGITPASLLSMGIADQDAPLRIPDIARLLAGLIVESRPEFLCTHPFEGGHPDHDAVALGAWAACLLAQRDGVDPPAVIEMASYHLGPDGAAFGRFAEAGPELALPLSDVDFARKQRMLDAHATQRDRLDAFRSRVERFRLAPAHAWNAPPNGGRLLYEHMALGWRGAAWREAAGRALSELGLESAP